MTGAVAETTGDRVMIRPEACGDCFGCCQGGCAGNRLIAAENPRRLPLRPGLRVEVRSPAAALIPQALGSLLPPALGFAAGFALSGPVPGMAGLFLGGLAVYLFRRRFPPGDLPQISRIL